MKAVRVAAAVLFLLALALPSPAFAGWESSYKDGKAAYDAGEYAKAIKLLKEAIDAKGDEKANALKSSGMFFESYLPHYYLGMALFQKKDFKGAIDELNASEEAKVIQKSKDLFAQLRQTRTAAEAAAAAGGAPPQVAQNTPPPPAATPPKETPPETVKETPKETPPPVKEAPKPAPIQPVPMGPDPALTSALNAAAADIAAAQKFAVDNAKYLDDGEKRHLDTLATDIRGGQTPAAVGAKRQELDRAIAELRGKSAERKKAEDDRLAQQRKDQEALQARAAQNKALADAVAKANPVFTEAEGFLADNRTNLAPADAQKIQGLLEGARRGATPDAVTKSAAELKGAVSAARRSLDDRRAATAREAQAQYGRAVEAYFNGHYDDALPALLQASGGLPKDATLKGMLGSTYYKKYLLSNGADTLSKQQAEEAFRSAVSVDRSFSLDPRYFPPKIVAYFKEVTGRR
ncbi:MAG: hypothetical protein HY049_02770 [Acidobacteria bacterium]|nr:hypothetical protein [Acidobacteriota bacterium]